MKFLIIILPFIYNYIYLFYRKSNLFKGYKKWFIVFTYLAIGSIYNSLISHENNAERIIQIWAFFTPLIFTFYILLCTMISKKINNRDFKLHLRYSKEIDYLNQKEIEVSPIHISEETLQQFIYEMAIQVNPRSQSRLISGLKSFFNYLIFEDYRKDTPLELI